MAAKKGAAKERRLQTPPFTEVEDFYVSGKAGHVPAGEIAVALGRSLSEVEVRMRDLGIDVDEAVKKATEAKKTAALKGSGIKFNQRTGEVESVVMTEGRSLMDDQAAGITPAEFGGRAKPPRRKNLHDQFRHKS